VDDKARGKRDDTQVNGSANTLEYKRGRFVARFRTDYLYSQSHFWLARQENGLWRAGLTRFGTRLIGEMVDYGFGLEPNAAVRPGQVVGWVEGFKAVADLCSLLEGEFAGGNPALEDDVTLINNDPHHAGWLYAVRGRPDAQCLPIEAYVQFLDETIDRMLKA
jgi:glycine cleavage system H protein